jgi:hypothetical protein
VTSLLPAERTEIQRETIVMILYVSVVEIAELAALPQPTSDGGVDGVAGAELLAILWGTAIGLALAHWFAFQLAAEAFRGERYTRTDTIIGLAHVAAAVFVAIVSSLPILLFAEVTAARIVGFVPALIIGVVAYLIARQTRTRPAAMVYGASALALGVLVAAVKSTISAH